MPHWRISEVATLRIMALTTAVAVGFALASVSFSSSASAFGRFGGSVQFTTKYGGWHTASPTHPGNPTRHWERRQKHYDHFRRSASNSRFSFSSRRSFRR